MRLSNYISKLVYYEGISLYENAEVSNMYEFIEHPKGGRKTQPKRRPRSRLQ